MKIRPIAPEIPRFGAPDVGDWFRVEPTPQPEQRAQKQDAPTDLEECDCPNFTECARNSGCMKESEPLAPIPAAGWQEGKPPKDGLYMQIYNNKTERLMTWHDGFWYHAGQTNFNLDNRLSYQDNRKWRLPTSAEQAEYDRIVG